MATIARQEMTPEGSRKFDACIGAQLFSHPHLFLEYLMVPRSPEFFSFAEIFRGSGQQGRSRKPAFLSLPSHGNFGSVSGYSHASVQAMCPAAADLGLDLANFPNCLIEWRQTTSTGGRLEPVIFKSRR
jgi:hypothetical protein